MRLYDNKGYLNIPAILAPPTPFIFVVGGRATGKTYGLLKYAIDNDKKLMYMRRTQAQAELINKPQFSPFKALNTDGYNITTKPISKYNSGFYDGNRENIVIGYSASLSTIANLRGFDAHDVELFVYDEFIRERHEKPIKNEGKALLNAYETINRNRELQGRDPVKMVCLANAEDLANPVFLELGLVRKTEEMRRTGQEIAILPERGIAMYILSKSPISAAKRDTALYRLTRGSDFENMAINNTFSGVDYENIKSRPLKEYNPVVQVGEITIYRHKSNNRIYISPHTTGTPIIYGTSEAETRRFRRAFIWLWEEYMRKNIDFEEYICEVLFLKYIS